MDSHTVHGGYVRQETSWVTIMRGRTQFEITVQHKRIEATDFGDRYLPKVEAYNADTLGGLRRLNELLQSICNHCLPLLEQFAPQASILGYSLEDLVRSPTYRLEVVRKGTTRDTRILGVDVCSYTPALNMCPMKTADLPAAYKVISRFHAEQIMVNVDKHDLLGSVQGRVETPDGRSLYLKPRESGREKQFHRELGILNDIKEKHVAKGQIKLPGLLGIVVVSGESEEECVGVLINLITAPPFGMDLLSPGCWARHELHEQWEQQVTATVEELHAHGVVWGDVNAGNVVIDKALDAWVIDFGGMNNPEFLDDDKAETIEGDWQGVRRLFREWLPSRRAGVPW